MKVREVSKYINPLLVCNLDNMRLYVFYNIYNLQHK